MQHHVFPPEPEAPPAAAPNVRRVVEIAAETDARYAAYVDAHPDALVYHHPLWLRVLRREYPQDLLALACLDTADRVVGVLPLLATRGLPLGIAGPSGARRLASLPRTPVAGPLADRPEIAADLVLAALERARSRPGTHLQVKAASGVLPSTVGPLHARPWRTSFALDLPADPSALRFGNAKRHGRITWAVNKAHKEGVVVRPPTSLDEVGVWYRLYLDTMRSNLVPPRPYRLFAAAWELLVPSGLMTMLLAVRPGTAGGDVLAGSIFLHHGSTVFYAFNGRRADTLALRPNDAILHRAITDAVAAGFTRFDLGEVVRGGTGLAEFKAKWGAAAATLVRYHHPDPGGDDTGGDAHADDDPDPARPRAAMAIAGRVWRRMPLGLTAVMGEQVYRFL